MIHQVHQVQYAHQNKFYPMAINIMMYPTTQLLWICGDWLVLLIN